MELELKELIKRCDITIKQEDIDTLMNYYTDDAILVIKHGMIAQGKRRNQKSIYCNCKMFLKNQFNKKIKITGYSKESLSE